VAAQLAQALTRMRWRNEDALSPTPAWTHGQRFRHTPGSAQVDQYGPPMLRHLLFMGAMSAIKTALYKPNVPRPARSGLETTQALVVVARRIARIAFAMFKTGQPFDPSRLSPSTPKCLTKP